MSGTGLEAVFLSNRDRLLAFLRAHGAGDAAEDLLQELWLKVAAAPAGPIARPLSYLYRAANNLMLDRYRSRQQALRRDRHWSEAATTLPGRSDEPSSERRLIAEQQLMIAQEALEALGPRPAAIFRRHRLDGVGQRQIAAEFGISISTVESDLRRAYRAMIELRSRFDEE
jgi:RNA polymerase sigma-70 factor (ECF subfamily)